ncbi:hypothetical protein LPY66_11370 [Dehalobacter sp. DCM]|uniref:replication initiation factor domain-containing protein n=1 Tax=Dehalobacter sp. DCM TaxID=2907827 RepID=UPI00308152D0|nr:hypothetical protein LPY66_11370 [Dehalobacter sp. DCM]
MKTEKISLDMIRLRCKRSYAEIEEFFNKHTEYDNVFIEFYIQSKAAAFGYNYKIMTNDGSFWMGCGHNSEKRGLNTNLYIEYNPNKLQNNAFLQKVLSVFFRYPKTEIISCDIAKDFSLPMINFIGDMKRKREVKIFNTSKGKTIYIGKGDGRAKLYDKAKEQGLKGVDWTRFEVSLNIGRELYRMDTFGYKGDLPSVFYAEQSLALDAEEKAVIYALSDNVINLNEFSRRKRDKYKEILSNFKEISFSSKEIYQVLNDYVKGVV